MKEVKLPIHKHPLLPVTRFSRACNLCEVWGGSIYGGYRCNELECQSVFHRECAESLPEINHSSHPDHPLKLLLTSDKNLECSRCGKYFKSIYICSICDFKLDLHCAKRSAFILENSSLHQHPLELFFSIRDNCIRTKYCKTCKGGISCEICYNCYYCDLVFHVECVEFFPEANHNLQPLHPLKLLTTNKAPDYADKKCLLCRFKFLWTFHHCDVCNFSICTSCMKYPPPVHVESPTTHEHQLHLVPRRIDFTCNACGTLGDRSPYFCLQCNFMIHRECIDLPRVININRHDHRISYSYTRRLGHREEWKCKVCRKKVDGFYPAYTCVKCPSFAIHSLCATRWDVWDQREQEEMPEEEENAPFEVIDDNTIIHFSHDHNLIRINKDGHGRTQPENIVCEACRRQILSEPFYSCKQCNFILHESCANHPRKKRHVSNDLPLTLLTKPHHRVYWCRLCKQNSSGFSYKIRNDYMDVRCAAISDTIEHESHQHPLFFCVEFGRGTCSRCGKETYDFYRCDECDYILDCKCVHFPKKVVKNRYDDHPLFLSFGDKDEVDGGYWCEACETKVNPKEWFYTCNECGTILHISCVVGDFSYVMPGASVISRNHPYFARGPGFDPYLNGEVVSSTSVCRPLCFECNSRCKLPSVLKISNDGVDYYFCSTKCSDQKVNRYYEKKEKSEYKSACGG